MDNAGSLGIVTVSKLVSKIGAMREESSILCNFVMD